MAVFTALGALGSDSLSLSHTLLLLTYASLAYLALSWFITSIYNLYFHPLRHFPGPKLWLLFPITRQIDSVLGRREHKTLAYHETYGPVVRASPDMLTFTSADAWRDIYGPRGAAELPKFFGRAGPSTSIIDARDPQTHGRFRRAMLPAFSDKALAEQDMLIGTYVDLLTDRLREVAAQGEATDMVRWFNFTTFDLIGDLAFGETLGGLENEASNAWLDRIQTSIKLLPIIMLMTQYVPGLGLVLGRLFRRAQQSHVQMVKAMVARRIEKAEYGHRGDFMDQIMRNQGKESGLTHAELAGNADIMMIAGSETTSTLLSGVTYMLLTHPEKMERCKAEVRGAFERKEDFSFAAVSSKLPYTLACLNETMRIYPSVPIVMFRQTQPGHTTPIAGEMVPPGTKVGVPQLAAFHSTLNWHRPTDFLPERWLPAATTDPTSDFFHDQRDVHKPFSYGPRDCIGRNLAYHEMRLIFARLLWEFDLALREESRAWSEQKIRVFWDKKPLMVDVRRRAF